MGALTSLLSLRSRRTGASLRPLPSLCAVCHDWGAGRICDRCTARFARPAPRCASCAVTVPDGVRLCADCLREPPPFARAVAAVDYAFPWDGLVRKLKFHDALDLAASLSEFLVGAVIASSVPMPSLLLPMPLAPRRLRERGFNQAALLARPMARRLGLDFDAGVLERVLETPQLAGLPREPRAKAVRGAFALDARRAHAVTGRHIALVDDVVTTGATAAEASRVLLTAGAASVQLWVLARTPAPG